MPNSFLSQPKKWLLPVILTAVVILLFVIIGASRMPSQPLQPATNRTATASKSAPVKKTEVPPSKLPDKFPSSLPLEVGAKVVQNYNATTKDGTVQATRVFETTKSLADNFTLYKNFLSANGWTIKASLDQDQPKVLSADKGKQQLQITIGENTITKVKTVSITLTQKP